MLLCDSKTNFPKFNLNESTEDEIPTNLEESSVDGSDDESVKYENKEDQDVAVFMSLIEKMSVNSLLFILQNHARQMYNISDAQLQKVLVASRGEQNKAEEKTPECLHKIKKFRFAEILGGTQIREEVYEIPHVHEMADEEKELLWWNREDQRKMRLQARKAVKYFCNRRPEYAKAAKRLSESYLFKREDLVRKRNIMKKALDSFPRGLEYHIVSFLGECRDESLLVVLDLQARIASGNSARHDEDPEMISEKYRQASLPCRNFALNMAQFDHIEALKATLSL